MKLKPVKHVHPQTQKIQCVENDKKKSTPFKFLSEISTKCKKKKNGKFSEKPGINPELSRLKQNYYNQLRRL